MRTAVESDADQVVARMQVIIDDGLPAAVQEATKLVSDLIKADMAGPAGLTRFPRHDRRTPTPAAPGGPPAQVTGRMARSVRAAPVRKSKQARSTGRIGARTPYAHAVANGTGGKNAYPFVEGTRRRILASGRAQQVYVMALRVALDRKG